MDVFWIASGGAAALPAGTVLRGQVARLSVRGGEPDEMCCRECAATLPGPPALRCGHCGSWIGAPLAIELATAVVLALLFARIGFQPVVAAFAFLGALGVALGHGWQALLMGASLGFVLAAVAGLVMLAARRISRRSMISFGPYMLVGALLAVLSSPW